ncbi:hypothetical protein HIM_07071 [Hirsutella minnesotensis 3608]|uniref:Wax synthase domain-containing protein n=1 Tax=Hirsutella minnesotensis 3608 TaxID=1043627 RepID=A0A0F7ZNC6_9HYPO|nr:hypothetical protein HIM_07071 [Hirsutella minnesotensis 3608]
MDSLIAAVRSEHRARFHQAVRDGDALPLLIPYSLLGVFVLPVLWLAIPHTRRPWWYQTRWLVAVAGVAFNLHIISTCSSGNLPFSYASGLMAAWGIIWSLNLLIWTRPQFDAARVVKVTRPAQRSVLALESPSTSRNNNLASPEQGAVKRRTNKSVEPSLFKQDGAAEDVYVWQPYPVDGPYLQRLGWALDLVTSFRGAGWNWSVPIVPHPRTPPKVSSGDIVDLDSMALQTRSGYSRCQSEGEFVRKMLLFMAAMYLIADFGLLLAANDPYFIFGPDRYQEVASHLLGIPPWLILAYRELICLAIIVCYLTAVFVLGNFLHYWFLKFFFPSYAALWRHPSAFGAFSQVLDRGLAGWWGGFWHQTFRVGFSAPANYFIEHGYLGTRSPVTAVVVVCVSFLQSGLLHASGSISSIPNSKPWRSVAFFLLQAVGVVVQDSLRRLARRHFPNTSVAISRILNFSITILWLYFTADFFLADLASTGVTLSEPLPISPLRWLFSGNENEPLWRWGETGYPTWHVGRHWWESGIAL